MTFLRSVFLRANSLFYQNILGKILFRSTAQESHEQLLSLLTRADSSFLLQKIAALIHSLAFKRLPVSAGGVNLDFPFIVAAGMVKGHGFEDEQTALEAVVMGENIIPGWRSLPLLVGAVEMGSFTRYPRMGNPGTVIWRDIPGKSTQNRVGLKNPGVMAAAKFLGQHRHQLPPIFGVNIAVSPGVEDASQAADEIVAGLDAFLAQQVIPSWFTINLSCPNTEDDPGGNQTEAFAEQVCRTAVDYLNQKAVNVPLWVKVSPLLAENQYDILMRVFDDCGVRAVIATNTMAMPVPGQSGVNAGVGGLDLHSAALAATRSLQLARERYQYKVDVIGCGGLMNGETWQTFRKIDVKVIQYWSALVFRGPLAAAIISNELPKGGL